MVEFISCKIKGEASSASDISCSGHVLSGAACAIFADTIAHHTPEPIARSIWCDRDCVVARWYVVTKRKVVGRLAGAAINSDAVVTERIIGQCAVVAVTRVTGTTTITVTAPGWCSCAACTYL